MKAKVFVIISLCSLLFFSCGNLNSQYGETSITLDAGKVARYLGRGIDYNTGDGSGEVTADVPDMDAFMYNEMVISVSTEGSFSTGAEAVFSQSMTEASSYEVMEAFYKEAMGTPITLEEIPVGSTIKLNAVLSFGVAFDAEAYKKTLPAEYLFLMEEKLAIMEEGLKASRQIIEGSSEEFTVKPGENHISIRLGSTFRGDGKTDDEGIDIPIILYERGISSNIYSYQDGEIVTIDDESINEQLGFYNYCTDSNGNMYVLYSKNNEELGTNCYYIYSNNPVFSGKNVMIPINGYAQYCAIAYDSAEDKIYSYYKDSDNALKIVCLPNLISGGTASQEDMIVYTSAGFFSEYSDSGLFAVNNNIVYVGNKRVDNYGVKNIFLSAFNLSTAEGNELEENDEDYITDLRQNHNIKSINDTYYEDGNLYILVTKNLDGQDVSGVLGGGIIKLDLTYKESSELLFSEDKLVSLMPEANGPLYFPQPDSPEARDSFFCPKKIIGIKPKKLIIADDGVFLYTNSEGAFRYKNINRVVSVDLDSYKITNVLPVDVSFEEEKTASLEIATSYGEGQAFVCDD